MSSTNKIQVQEDEEERCSLLFPKKTQIYNTSSTTPSPISLAALPLQILISIVEYLIPISASSGIPKPTIVHHTLSKGQKRSAAYSFQFSKTSSQLEKIKTSSALWRLHLFAKTITTLSLVCKSFYEVSTHDVIWKHMALVMYRELVLRRTLNIHEIFVNTVRRNCEPREIVKYSVRLEGRARESLVVPPTAGYQQFCKKLKRMQQQQYQEFNMMEKLHSTVAKNLQFVFDWRYMVLVATLATAVTLCICLSLIGITVHQAIDRYSTVRVSRYYYWISFFPMLLAAPLFLMLLGVSGSAMLPNEVTWRLFNLRNFKHKCFACVCGTFGSSLLLAGIGAMVLGVMLNIAAFPYLSTVYGVQDPYSAKWDRRVHLVPWLVNFIPLYLMAPWYLFVVLCDNRKEMSRDRTKLTDTVVNCVSVGLAFCSLILVCIKLEMPKVTAFSIAYCLIPLVLSAIIQVVGSSVTLAVNWKTEAKTKFSKAHQITSLVTSLLSVLAAVILCFQETVIGPFVWLSIIPYVISLILETTLTEFESYETRLKHKDWYW